MSLRLASSLFTLSLLSTFCPTAAHAETPQGTTAPRVASSATAASPPQEVWAPTYRLGLEGGTLLDTYAENFSLGMRFEVLPSPQTSVLARVSYLHGPDSDGLFEEGVAIATAGFRHYAGSLYAGAEVGVVFEAKEIPILQGSFGVKTGPLDFGVAISTPFERGFVLTGVTVGLDLFSLSTPSPSRPQVRKVRAPVAMRAPSAQR